jgi:hypothetical protein
VGTSTDGQLCYGILVGEDLPWTEQDLELIEWWREVNDCPVVSPYTEAGEYKPGITNGDAYFELRHKWDDENPVPVEEVNFCSGDCPAYILAVPSTVKTAYRGSPLEIDPVLIFPKDGEQALIDFCNRIDIVGRPRPKWYLSSYWGS